MCFHTSYKYSRLWNSLIAALIDLILQSENVTFTLNTLLRGSFMYFCAQGYLWVCVCTQGSLWSKVQWKGKPYSEVLQGAKHFSRVTNHPLMQLMRLHCSLYSLITEQECMNEKISFSLESQSIFFFCFVLFFPL